MHFATSKHITVGLFKSLIFKTPYIHYILHISHQLIQLQYIIQDQLYALQQLNTDYNKNKHLQGF